MKKLSESLTAVFGVIAFSAVAAQAGDTSALFAKLDSDKDGYVSVNEAEADQHVLTQFNQLDSNGDGRLSKDEFAAYEKKMQ